MRSLSPAFLTDLSSGLLAPLAARVRADRTLCLAIRENYLNVYYRGSSVLRLGARGAGYGVDFDPNYFAHSPRGAVPIPGMLVTSGDVAAWLAALPLLKEAIDLFLGANPKDEREVQQLLLRDNNFGGAARATDYYVCDIEYANQHGRFDFVGVHWPSSSATRKNARDRRLVLGEVKCGDDAIAGNAGLASHVRDVNAFLASPTRLHDIKEEMCAVFNQKLSLCLLDCGKRLESFSDEMPLLLLVLANHDPDSTRLRTELSALPPSPHAELRVARASMMGYGFFDQGLCTVADLSV